MSIDTDESTGMQEDPYEVPSRLQRNDLVRKRRGRKRAALVGAVVLAVAVGGGIAFSQRASSPADEPASADQDVSAAPTAAPSEPVIVSDSDEVVTQIPQEPSLSINTEDEFSIENDGNVTMSQVIVAGADGATICDLGNLSPGDVSPCPGAEGVWATVTGSGPQGQTVELKS